MMKLGVAASGMTADDWKLSESFLLQDWPAILV